MGDERKKDLQHFDLANGTSEDDNMFIFLIIVMCLHMSKLTKFVHFKRAVYCMSVKWQ